MQNSFKLIIIALMLCVSVAGCSEKSRTRAWGGTSTVDLPANKKLMNVTWKDTSLWILTRDMKDGEVAESYTFKEDSSLDQFEGTVYLIEHKQ